MARSYEEYKQDQKMLSKLKIGDRVRYTLKDKIGVVAKFVEYRGSYCYGYRQYREDCPYIAVVVHLDDGKSHISVSPRNLVKVRKTR